MTSVTEPSLELARRTCAGRLVWRAAPERVVSECVRARGHAGDHRDAAGYPWNDGRWLE